MNENDFIPGKWYVSSDWIFLRAARFLLIKGGIFTYDQKILKNESFHAEKGCTGSDKGNWSNFRELSIKEMNAFLPLDHPDKLIATIPRYVKFLPTCSGNFTGEVFDTNLPVPKYKHWESNTWKGLLGGGNKKYFQAIEKEEEPEEEEDEMMEEE